MTATTTTGENLLVGLGKFIDDHYASTTTSAGTSTGTTIVDTKLEAYGDNRLVGSYIRITESTAANQVARITANAQATGTVTVSPPFSAQIASGIDYQLHKFEPRLKFYALDSARMPVSEFVFRLVYDETLTTDGLSRQFDIPSTIRRGPMQVYVEDTPTGPESEWNFLPSPICDNVMADWTASNATLTTYARAGDDRLIPKYGTACTKISVAGSTNGTVSLVVADMTNNVTAAKSAGRTMTYAHWIYCKTASRVTLKILDDSGTLATSAAHQGRGWELLSITDTPARTNATTLTVRIDVSSAAAAVVAFANSGYFYFGDDGMVRSTYYSQTPIRVRRDATTQRFYTPNILTERRQLRLVGKEILTALGTDTTTQTTNTMEVDETTAEILYAEAAEILFQQERVSTQNLPQVVERIRMARDRAPQLRMLWEYDVPSQHISSPYMR